MDQNWIKMIEEAKAIQGNRKLSDYIEAGGVAAAVLSESGRIYTGVCVDTACTLGICAERNALFHMISCGEHRFTRVLAIMSDGRLAAPCGACREFMVQLMPDNYRNVEILLENERVVRLGDLTPEWWV